MKDAIWAVAVLLYGSLVVTVTVFQVRAMKRMHRDAPPFDAAARRGLAITLLILLGFAGVEAGAWFLGDALGGRYLGGALMSLGLVVFVGGGFALAVRVDARAGRLGQPPEVPSSPPDAR